MVLQNDDNSNNIAVKLSKRGNDVYQYRNEQKFKELVKLAYDLDYDQFGINDFDKKTKCLFLTLTYDTKRCGRKEAWDNIGKEFNRYLSNLKRKFGKFEFVRCFESHVNGYPHIHMILFFDEKEFEVFEHCPTNDIMQGSTFRVQEKKQFESWHSFIDVLAVNNMGQGLMYLTKYLRKTNYTL